MNLERWDPIRQKWVLYRNQEEHSADCAKYPFESIPRSIFLDTNVINLLVTYRDQIFEQASIKENVHISRKIDIEALMHVFSVGMRAGWNIAASRKSLDEINETKDQNSRQELWDFAINFVDTTSKDHEHAASLGRRLISASFLQKLPDSADRELIGNAIGLGCDTFCTCDRRTIIRKRELLPNIPIRIMTPTEWWSQVKPWGALWL